MYLLGLLCTTRKGGSMLSKNGSQNSGTRSIYGTIEQKRKRIC